MPMVYLWWYADTEEILVVLNLKERGWIQFCFHGGKKAVPSRLNPYTNLQIVDCQ